MEVAAPAIEAHNLYRFFHALEDETFALRGVSLSVAAGEMVATYELRLGEDVFHVDIADWEMELHRGAAADADAAIDADPEHLAAVLTGQLSLDDALESGALRIEGGRRAVSRFLGAFPMPEAVAA